MEKIDKTNNLSSRMVAISDKLQSGERLDFADGIALFTSDDFLTTGLWADMQAVKTTGREVYYCLNTHINYTNICRLRCSFCGFCRRDEQDGGYILSPAQVARQARQAYSQGATEVHIVGGINPTLTYDYYREMLRTVREFCPELHIKAFTAVEIWDLAEKAALSPEEVLQDLQAAGLNALPGGGAEILDADFFRRYCPGKPGPDTWHRIHKAAHSLGLMSNATILYGYREDIEQRVTHLLQIRQWQDEALQAGKGHFQCFVPLPYLPQNSRHKATGKIDAVTDLKMMAVSRLILDNFAYIKAFWPMLGLKLAEAALCFGANDVDGTVRQYKIVGQNRDIDNMYLSEDSLHTLISQAGKLPVKRDGYYRPLPPTCRQEP